jgi:hypothetical protein
MSTAKIRQYCKSKGRHTNCTMQPLRAQRLKRAWKRVKRVGTENIMRGTKGLSLYKNKKEQQCLTAREMSAKSGTEFASCE